MRVDELSRAVEGLGEADYRRLSYYQQWTTSICQVMLERGVVTDDELGRRIAEVEVYGHWLEPVLRTKAGPTRAHHNPHPHQPDEEDKPRTRFQAMEIALRELLLEKALITEDELRAGRHLTMPGQPGGDLPDLDAVTLRRRIGAGEISPVALVDACIARIETVNPAINAVVTTCFERARGGPEGRARGRKRR